MRGLSGALNAWRFAFAWLLLLAVPFQGFADAWLQTQGTAHTHEWHAHELPASHSAVERHQHPADDASVVIAHSDEHQHEDAAAQDGGTVSGHPALAQAPWILPPALAGPAPAGQDRRFSSSTPARLDRPPINGAG